MTTAGITIKKGSLPILISAPHAYAHRRPHLCGSYKIGELWTDYLCEQLCLGLNAWGIYTNDLIDYDPNFYPLNKNPYKQAVRDILNENKIMYFLDLHGLSPAHDYDLGYYYAPRYTNSRKLAEQIAKDIDRDSLKGLNVKFLNFLDNEQETLGEFVVSGYKVPSVQLEIAKYIRVTPELRDTFLENMKNVLITLPIQ